MENVPFSMNQNTIYEFIKNQSVTCIHKKEELFVNYKRWPKSLSEHFVCLKWHHRKVQCKMKKPRCWTCPYFTWYTPTFGVQQSVVSRLFSTEEIKVVDLHVFLLKLSIDFTNKHMVLVDSINLGMYEHL